MNIKIRLKISDLFKILFFNKRILLADRYNDSIITICKGKDTYICKI